MNHDQAVRLICDTFERPFDRDRFRVFAKNLLNRVQDSTLTLSAAQLPAAFQPYVASLERLGSYEDPFHNRLDVLVARLHKETSLHRARAMQRNFIGHYLSQGTGSGTADAALVAFVPPDADTWRFSFVKLAYRLGETARGRVAVKPDVTPTKRLSYSVGKGEGSHTAQARLLPFLEDDASDPGLDRIEEAFSVEAVTKQFFEEYEHCFYKVVKPAVKKILVDDADAHKFTQLLLNRLLFCWFLQKKSWLGGKSDYLLTLFDRAQNYTPPISFYDEYLTHLFFEVLCNPAEARRQPKRGDPKISWEAPFLNGGLFERSELDLKFEALGRVPRLPSPVFKAVLEDLFSRYNFTIEESTPLDVQVALDPELLGTIFERLVTGRHETGSYYTPRPVVGFMCREALVRYLTGACVCFKNGAHKIAEALVYDPDVTELSVTDSADIVRALDSVRVCDLACGSGAYLVTMLHELVGLYRTLFSDKLKEPQKDYDLKLRIIQRNLYGVDLDDFAVNIARLRLWLSLVVDSEETDVSKVKPLPNLDFKMEVGDSLSAANPEDSKGQLSLHADLVKDYHTAKSKFLSSHGPAKPWLRQEADELRQKIATWVRHKHAPLGFDWPVEFAEVFADGGFDIVVANPPYVRADAQFKHITAEKLRQAEISRWKVYRATLLDSGIYKTLYEKWDLYVAFLERAHQLLRPGGQMVFIISDAYNAAKYAKKSHEFFLRQASIERIDFCTDIPLFDAGVSNTILHYSKAPPAITHVPVRVRRWGKTRDEFESNVETLLSKAQVELGAEVFKLDAGNQVAAPQGFVPLGHICYISKGMVIHADERECQGAFSTDDVLSSSRDARHPRRFVLGKDVDKWTLRNVRFLEWGTKRAPRQFSRPTFPELHGSKEKLVAVRTPGAEPKVTYDEDCLHYDASSVGFVPWHLLHGVRNKSIKKTAKYRSEVTTTAERPLVMREQMEETSRQYELKYVLAVMNSTSAKDWLAARRRSKMHVYPDDWKQLPIAPIPKGEQQAFVKLVDAILAEFKKRGFPLPPASAARVAELEHQIDERVKGLYGL
ncbi:MAG: Eco57I restriction-modification methylase domain-containing protein [candidate division WOR-3 bacterium]|nr:Eco57I restriction-modification methylase domain-containing protein [candidate division WOR-3 bacterium]